MMSIASAIFLSNAMGSFGLRRPSHPNLGTCLSDTKMLFKSDEPFEDIYKTSGWGANEGSLSGPGSMVEATQVACKVLGATVHRILNEGKRNISILDAPMGDFYWQPPCLTKLATTLPYGAHVTYKGVDISATAVERAEARRQKVNMEKTTRVTESVAIEPFAQLDLAKPHGIPENLGTFDIILCNDALMHNSEENIFKILRNFNEGAKYLVVNSYIEGHDNKDIEIGQFRRLDLTSAPYNFTPICGDRETTGPRNRHDKGEFIVTYKLPITLSS